MVASIYNLLISGGNSNNALVLFLTLFANIKCPIKNKAMKRDGFCYSILILTLLAISQLAFATDIDEPYGHLVKNKYSDGVHRFVRNEEDK